MLKDLYKWRAVILTIQYYKVINYPWIDVYIQCICDQNHDAFCVETDKLIQIFIQKGRRPRWVKTVLQKKDRAGRCSLPAMKTFIKLPYLIQCGISTWIDNRSMDQNRECRNRLIYGHWLYDSNDTKSGKNGLFSRWHSVTCISVGKTKKKFLTCSSYLTPHRKNKPFPSSF